MPILVIGVFAAVITHMIYHGTTETIHAWRGTESPTMRRWMARQAQLSANQPWHFNADGKTPFKRFWAGIWHNAWEDLHDARMRRRDSNRSGIADAATSGGDYFGRPGTFRHWWRTSWDLASAKASARFHAWRQQRQQEAERRLHEAYERERDAYRREREATETARRAAYEQEASAADPTFPPPPSLLSGPRQDPPDPPPDPAPPRPDDDSQGPHQTPGESPPTDADPPPTTHRSTFSGGPPPRPRQQHPEPDRPPIHVDAEIVRPEPEPEPEPESALRELTAHLSPTTKENATMDNNVAVATPGRSPAAETENTGELGTRSRAERFTSDMNKAIALLGEQISTLAAQMNSNVAEAQNMIEQCVSDLTGAGTSGPATENLYSGGEQLAAAARAHSEGVSHALTSLEMAQGCFTGALSAFNRHMAGTEYHRSNTDSGGKAYHANE